jgi:hypothetical protein
MEHTTTSREKERHARFALMQIYIGFLRAVGMGAVLEVFRMLYWR